MKKAAITLALLAIIGKTQAQTADTTKVAIVHAGAKKFAMGYLVETHIVAGPNYKPMQRTHEWKAYNAKWLPVKKYAFAFPYEWNQGTVNADIPQVYTIYTPVEKRSNFK
jgi:hypothetical protein